MNPLEILVFEDINNVATGWARNIKDAYPSARVEVATTASLEHLLQVANRRRNEWRKDGHGAGMVCEHDADKKDLVIVDYDLLEYSSAIDVTGSRLAYLLRCFTACGFILILNARGPNPFDLSLRSSSEDFADLHIDGWQLGNPGLWNTGWRGYRPWYWPVIPDIMGQFESCVADVGNHFEEPIFDFFELNRVMDSIPWKVHEFLAGSGKPLQKVTFRDFVKYSRAGTDNKDKLLPDQASRMAASRIRTLLNSVILPDQNALVDAPHLVSRFPSLIKGPVENIESWNLVCDSVGSDVYNLVDERLERFQFAQPHWLWRPAWYWPEVRRYEGFDEVNDPWKADEAGADWAFCENISRFLPVELTQTFRALVSPPFMKRFLLNRYSSGAVELVPELSSRSILDPLEANYTPEAMLSY